MKEIIKKYELKNGVTPEDLKVNGFQYSISGVINNISTPRYVYINYILEDIELLIEIGVNEDGTLLFDDYKNVLVLDDDFCQPYHPFYESDEGFEYLNDVIVKYNNAMDSLVKKGILTEKQIDDVKLVSEQKVRQRELKKPNNES